MTREEEITQCLKHLISEIEKQVHKGSHKTNHYLSIKMVSESIVDHANEISKYLTELNSK